MKPRHLYYLFCLVACIILAAATGRVLRSAQAAPVSVPLPTAGGEWNAAIKGQIPAAGSLEWATQTYAQAWRDVGWDVNVTLDGDQAHLAALTENCQATAATWLLDGDLVVVGSVTCWP